MERYKKMTGGQLTAGPATVKGIDASGQTRWTEIQDIAFSWRGKPAIMSLITDITDKVRLQEELKEREERLRAVIENAWDGITILDENYHIIFESPSVARMAGYTPEELVGRDVLQTAIHPDDLAPLASQVGDSEEPARFHHPGRQDAVPAQGRFLAMDRGHRAQPSP